MGKPWEKTYEGVEPVAAEAATTKMTLKPWEKQYDGGQKAPTQAAPQTRETKLDDFIPNLDTPLAMASGFNQGALMGYAPNLMSAVETPFVDGSYTENRDRIDRGYNNIKNTNPLAYYSGNAIGGILPALAAPFSKVAQGGKYAMQMMGLAGDAALQGAVQNPGNVPGQVTPIQGQERIDNAKHAAVLAPLIGTGFKAAGKIPEIPQMMRNQAEKWAYKSSGPQLSNTIVDQAVGRDKQIGRYMLDQPGLVEYGGTTGDVAKIGTNAGNTGGKITQLFDHVDNLFDKAINKPGFNPKTDRAGVMAQAQKELGETEGGAAALNRLNGYFDEVAARNGEVTLPPSKMREIKTAMDERVKYARNPQNPDPATDKAFYGGRTEMNNLIDDSIEQLAPGQNLLGLKDLNNKYSMEKSIDAYSNKREARDAANKGLSLTDWMVGPHSIPGLVAKKTGEKFGYQTGARAFEDMGAAGQAGSNMLNLDLNLGALKNAPPETTNAIMRYLMMNPQEKK